MANPQHSAKLTPSFPAGCSAITISRLGDLTLLNELQGIVDYFFGNPLEYYLAMDADHYRGLVVAAQDQINHRRLARRIAGDQRDNLEAIIGSSEIMIQTNLYLRATRPIGGAVQEHIGWHRESFYGPDLETSINLWMPIQNVTVDNAMRYIPDSQSIPDSSIKTVYEDSVNVSRYSAGHRIGLLYAPRRIVSGVDLSQHRPLVAIPGEVAIFSGALIHGAAKNRSCGIRFSVDFRLIAKENLSISKEHFASGKPYFEQL